MKAFITAAGRELPVHFGIRAINEFSKDQSLTFADTINGSGVDSLERVIKIAVVGLNEGARRAGAPERFTEDNVWDMVDDEPELIIRIGEIFMESVQPLMDKLGAKAEDFRTPTPTPNRA